jgi:hypothetical protein
MSSPHRSIPRSAVRGENLLALVLALAAAAAGCETGSSGMDGGTDAGPPGLTCGRLLTCDQGCTSQECTNQCYADATAVAQGLFVAFTGCLDANCSAEAGGPCADSSSSTCSDCNQTAALGPCVSSLVSCQHDTSVAPANPDGGVVAPPDAGPTYNCGQLLLCENACTSGDEACRSACSASATPEARALNGVLYDCLEMACPSTPGGPCEMPGLECNGCIEQVTLAEPNTCADPYVACNMDTSTGGPGVPRTFVDGGVLSTVLTGLRQPASTILASDGYLYYTQVVHDEPVSRLSLEGDAGVVTTLGPPQPTPVSLAVDSNNVYVWSVGTFELGSSFNNQDGTVVQVPLNGDPAITLGDHMEVFYDAAYLNAVAVDSTHVYWVAGANGSDGAIMRAPIGGGRAAVAIYTGLSLPQGVVTDGTNVYWVEWGTFDADGRAVNDGSVWQGSVDGTATRIQLAENQPAPSGIAIDASWVYWTNLGPLGGLNLPAPNSGSIMMAPIGGGTLTTIADSQAVPVCIIVSGSRIYWSQYGLSAPGLIMTAPTGGGAVTPLVAGLYDPAAIAIWGDTIYWTDANSSPDSGYIMSLSPF